MSMPMQRLLHILVPAFCLAVNASESSAQCSVELNFSSLGRAGTTIEGQGVVNPLVNINATLGQGVSLLAGTTPPTYGAPNDTPIFNGGLSPGGGFGDISPGRANDFVFTFAPTALVSEFSVRMLDCGDYNPGHATSHSVKLVAYNVTGVEVDSDTLSWTSSSDANPGSLWLSGDAVSATPGEPGNFTFRVAGEIASTTLIYWNNGSQNGPSDPNIAFDSVSIVVNPTVGSMTSYGLGCPGSGGFTPALTLAGCGITGGSLVLGLSGGLGGSSAFLFVGNQQASLPIGPTCTLNVSPPIGPLGPFLLGGSGAGGGSMVVPVTIPSTVSSAVVATLQGFVADPGVPRGYANTNGLEVTIQ